MSRSDNNIAEEILIVIAVFTFVFFYVFVIWKTNGFTYDAYAPIPEINIKL